MGEVKPIKAYKASSKRIKLHSMSEAEMRDLIAATTDLDKQTDYIERFNKALADRKACIYYLPWKIEDKKTKEEIGWFMYDGPMKDNTVTVNVTINEDKRRNGYAFETLKTMASYSEMANGECYVIDGVIDKDNEAAAGLLKKVGFAELDADAETVRYGLFRRYVPSAFTWMSIGMLFGLCYNTTLGSGIGIAIGIVLGYAAGASIDKKNLTKYVTVVNSVREKYNIVPVTEEEIKTQSNPFKSSVTRKNAAVIKKKTPADGEDSAKGDDSSAGSEESN